jgi:hypothetical protein
VFLRSKALALIALAVSALACASPTLPPTATPTQGAQPTATQSLATSSSVPTQTSASTPTGVPASGESPSAGPTQAGTPRPTLEPRPTPSEGTFQPVTVDSFGFTPVTSDGNDYTTYGAVLTNPNTEWAVYRMLVQVNLFDAADNFVGGAEVNVTILPGQTTAVSGQAFGAGSAVRMLVAPPDDPTPYVPFSSAGAIDVSGVATTTNETGTLTTGTLTSSLTSDQAFLQLFAVYRDASGAVIGGIPSAVESLPSGSSVQFEILDTQPPPGIASTEVYWQLGGQLP